MKFNNNLAELIGLMFGDGCLSRSGGKYLIYISGHKEDDFRYHNIRINYLFLEIFGKKTKVGFRKDEKTLFTRFSDKKIFHSFSSLGMPIGKKYKKLKIPFWIVENKELICGFARGLADTDGCIVFSKQHRKERCYPRIEITSKSE
ncbi:hypothetical protein ISS07_06735, partial [Candidatus Woesearchaeota archaeon]|nr:hypothetical protein [Candidatus Woesearchaeota archaeon]